MSDGPWPEYLQVIITAQIQGIMNIMKKDMRFATTGSNHASCIRRCSPGITASLYLLTVLSITCAWAESDHESSVRIAGVDYLGDLPTIVADKNNYFQRYGIEADIGYGATGKENLQRLRSGEIDFAMMALTPIVIDHLSDASRGGAGDPVILASVVHSTELNQVVTVAGRGIEAPRDLAGHRIALPMGTNAEFVWWLFAGFHGLEPTSVELLNHSAEESMESLLSGEVNAAVLWEPWTTRLRQRAGEILHEFTGSNIYTAKWVIVTTRQRANEQSPLCQAILAAYRDAIEYIGRNPDKAIRLYSRHAGIEQQDLLIEKLLPDFSLGLDWSLVSTLQQQFAWAELAGYGPATAEINILSLIASAPLKTVAPKFVGIPAL